MRSERAFDGEKINDFSNMSLRHSSSAVAYSGGLPVTYMTLRPMYTVESISETLRNYNDEIPYIATW